MKRSFEEARMTSISVTVLLLALAVCAGCSSGRDIGEADGGGVATDAGIVDAGAPAQDAGTGSDGGGAADTGVDADAGGGTDAGGGEDVGVASQRVLDLLAGDWMVYSAYDETPHIARSYHFWTFSVKGAEFEFGESCSGSHSYGMVKDGKALLYRMSAGQALGEKPSGTPVDGLTAIEVVNDTLAIREGRDGEGVGRSFRARPVQTLVCADDPSGGRMVAKQTAVPRTPPVQALAGALTRDAPAQPSTHQDLVDHLKASAGTLLEPQGDPDETGPVQKPGTTPTTTTDTNGAIKTTCVETQMTQQQIMSNFTMFDTSPQIYPGALIQGGAYMTDNRFDLITSGTQDDANARKRAPMTVQVVGPVLTGKLSATVADPSKSDTVAQAVADLIAGGVSGGVVSMDYYSTLATDEQQVDLSLGVSGGYEGFKLSTDFKAGIQEDSNHLVIYFFQKFYSVTVPSLGGALNAFDVQATDPADEITGALQIGAGNPPLYVSQVDYGKQIVFEIDSTFSQDLLETTFNLAIDADAASAAVNSSFKASDVLANATISYKVRGGSDSDIADWTVFPGTGGGDGTAVFNQLKTFFANLKAEPFKASTPGVPIGFTLNYLVDDTPAQMLYSADFSQKSCQSTAAPVSHRYSYSITDWKAQGIGGLDDYMTVSVDNTIIKTYDSPKGDQMWLHQADLDSRLADKGTHDVSFKIYNKGGWATGGTLTLFIEGNEIYRVSIHGGTGAWTGEIFEGDFKLNVDGTCMKTHTKMPGRSAGNIEYQEDATASCNQ